jgi:DNA primase catalytic subunit/predicted RNA-binding Zn-ribbon protein involved in translation (DUF1610 family)
MEEGYKKREQSVQEKKIRAITQLYYSRKEIQKAIFEFSKNREISPRFFDGFGKRPDAFNFAGDVYQMVKKGATSFHSSEELWNDPMEIETGMDRVKANNLRKGWDLLIDIDCEHGMNYSALVAKAIIETFRQHGIKNVGLKFSGSKGFHLLIPWKAFPKEINGIETKNLFPELPRAIVAYIRNYSEKLIQPMLPEDFYEKFKDKLGSGFKCNRCGNFASESRFVEFRCPKCDIVEIRKLKMGTKGEVPACYKCKGKMNFTPKNKFFSCEKCETDSLKFPETFSEIKQLDIYALMGLDLVLVSPRHLFRMPYSLHEKSSLVSVVLDEKDLDKFVNSPNYKEIIADPLRVKIKKFMPDVYEDEAAELVMQALDWSKDSGFQKEIERSLSGKYADFKPLKLENLKEQDYPPCIKKLLLGNLKDGKKRAVFALINFFRSIGLEKEDLEKKLFDWNEKNEEPLKRGYIETQLIWTYKRKPLLPPNCRDFYRDLGVCEPDNLCAKIKNPINYAVIKDSNQKKVSPTKKPKKPNSKN